MSQFISHLIRFFQQKYMKSFLIFGGLILVGVCFGQNASGAEYDTSDITKNIIEIFDLIFGLLALVLGPMVILAGWLLSPDWTMGDFFGLRGYFKEVWILVANIVYIIFALMLLYMAIMQIFGGAESEYAFKKKLPSFLVGILLVPFTWLIVSWTLSFANQAVAAVLSIPMGSIGKISNTDSGTQDTSMWHKKMLPTEFDFSTSGPSGYGNNKCSDGNLVNKKTGSIISDSSGQLVRCISPAEFLTKNQAGPFFIIMIYAYNIFKIQDADLQQIKESNFCRGDGTEAGQYKSAKGCVENLMDIVRDFGLSLIVTIFFAVMLLALCWVLLMRAIKLWVYIMLSPLFGLAYFTGEGLGTPVGEAGESGFGQVGFKAFFKLAMVPVLVSAVLAFGLLFVGVVRDNFKGGVKNPDQKEFCTQQGVGYMVTYCITEEGEPGKEVYKSKLIIGNDGSTDKNKNANITLNFGNAFSNIIEGAEGASAVSGAVSGGISSVDDIFAHIILTMMALVFMFMGVKVAANYDPVTEAAFKPFASLGESVGKFVAHSPSYLPLPHPAFASMMNPNNLTGVVDALRTKYDDKAAAPGKSLIEMISHPGLRDMDTMGGDELTQKFGNQVGSLEAVFREFKKRMEKIVKDMPEGAERSRLERQLAQANTVKDQDILRDMATDIKSMNDKTKFLKPEDEPIIKRLAESTTTSDIKARFSSTNQQYKNEDKTISLKPADWSSSAPTHGDKDFRTTMKKTFVDAGVSHDGDIQNMPDDKLETLKVALKTSTGIDFSPWDKSQLKNLHSDAQRH